MNDVVLVAIISGICTAVPTILLNVANNSKTKALISYRLDQIEQKQEKHNCFIERLYEVEKQTCVQREQLRVVNHQIESIKGA